jgi:hypothetical protein
MRLKYIFPCLMILTAHAQNLTVQVNGNQAGAESTLNLMPGPGIVEVCVDNPGRKRVDCTPSFNTALIPTHDTVHSNENYCASFNGSVQYTCRLPYTALTAYRPGLTFVLNVDTNCPAACWLNIDQVGAVSIKKIDGATDPGGALVAAQPQWVFYDGKVFRLMGGASGSGGGGGAAVLADQRGDVRARRLIAAMDSPSYETVMTLDVTAGDLHKIRTTPGAGNGTVAASTGGLPGQHMWIIITNDNTSPKTITFATNLRSAGPLAGAAGKTATIHFVSDGTAWYEVARTVGL